jgi:hypothetical protein
VACFHSRDQQAVPWCTGRRVDARGSLGVVTGAEHRDLFWDAACGRRHVDRPNNKVQHTREVRNDAVGVLLTGDNLDG